MLALNLFLNKKKPERVKQLLSDANLSKPDFNQNQFASFDPEDQTIGVETDADKEQHAEDPMSKTWKGHEYTHEAVLSGKFEGRTRKPDEKPVLGSEANKRNAASPIVDVRTATTDPKLILPEEY